MEGRFWSLEVNLRTCSQLMLSTRTPGTVIPGTRTDWFPCDFTNGTPDSARLHPVGVVLANLR